MKKLANLAFALVMILSLSIMTQSCKTVKDSSKKDYPGENTPNITGTWILKSLNGQATETIFKGVTPTMTINSVENRIHGNAGCNTYTGKYNYSEGILSAPNLASTMMACLDDNKESDFHKVLALSNKITLVNGETLTLTNNGITTAEFVKGVDTALLSGNWTLSSMTDADLSALFGDQLPTLTFDLAENRLGGQSGCNRYNATYKIEGTMITVGPAMSTRMACPNMDGESKFTKALTGTSSSLEVTGDKIIFKQEGKETLSFVKSIK